MTMRRLILGSLALLTIAVGITGCSRAPERPMTTKPDQLFISYQRHGPSGYMDQVLTILNKGPSAAAPTLEITPLDSTGAPVPGITVRTAYGTDRGKVVVSSQGEGFDVLAFSGADVARLADVRVKVRDVVPVNYVIPIEVADPQAMNGYRRPTTKFGPFTAVEVRNLNTEDITVGIVCIHWNQPPDGQPQQALAATELGVMTIPTLQTVTTPLSKSAQQAASQDCGSLKAYLAIPPGS
ncbi:hypothetical protein ACIBL3_26920 [Kribbella sp. NPDC050124]|uniref:hypothetical protein n=1 Tax=Kribbella sp. NPDC050124 TaxID=3364114 RepID=UPI0037897E21